MSDEGGDVTMVAPSAPAAPPPPPSSMTPNDLSVSSGINLTATSPITTPASAASHLMGLNSSSSVATAAGADVEPVRPSRSGSGSPSSSLLSLSWQDFPHTVAKALRLLQEEEEFVDVTLACHTRHFNAHKVILSACSPYFKKLLKSNPCQHPIVIMRDVSPDDLESLLSFMYKGEVRIEEERLKDFLRTAEMLQVQGLADEQAVSNGRGRAESSSTASPDLRDRRRARDEEEVERAQPIPPLGLSITEREDQRTDNGIPSSRGSPLFGGPNAKRHRVNGPDDADGDQSPASRATPPPSQENSGLMVARWASGIGRNVPEGEGAADGESDNNNKAAVPPAGAGGESLLSQALEKHPASMMRSSFVGDLATAAASSRDGDSTSDTASDKPESVMDGLIKSSAASDSADSLNRHLSSSPAVSAPNPLFPPGLEALYRQAGFPSAFLGLAAGAVAGGGPPGPDGGPGPNMGANLSGSPSPRPTGTGISPTHQHIGLQSHANNPNLAGKLDMMRVRATDPRPCPKCGKIYRSAHTLRTHMEDKHTVCPGYRCVLCGTVAKSRNSLHSHMSRQHRGISTKDLPVVPMPAPFDAGLASRLLAKAGVKVSPTELAARASPTAPRRSDLPKLDSNLLSLQHQQFPLPASLPASSMASNMMRAAAAANHHRDSGEFEDHRSSAASPFGGANGGGSNSGGGAPALSPSPRGLPFAPGLTPKDFAAMAAGGAPPGAPGGMGSALLDTYLTMIAAAGGGDTNAVAAALNLQNRAAFAASMAASSAAASAVSSASSPPLSHLRANGGGRDGGDEDNSMHAGELGSDAENEDDMSDGEADKRPTPGGGIGDLQQPGGDGRPAAAPAAAATN